jgi:hypothetical protein
LLPPGFVNLIGRLRLEQIARSLFDHELDPDTILRGVRNTTGSEEPEFHTSTKSAGRRGKFLEFNARNRAQSRFMLI